MSLARRPEQRRVRRWLAIVALSVLVHIAALDAFPRWTLDVAENDASNQSLRAILLSPVAAPVERTELAPTEPIEKPQPVRAAPQAASRAARTSSFARLPEFVPESLDQAIPHVDVVPQGSRTNAPPKPASPDAASTLAAAPPASAESSDKPTLRPQVEALAPSSARLSYKVVAVERKNANPVSYYGVGSISWTSADGRYQSDLTAAIDFILIKANVLALHSEGTITAAGLAPDRYTETPRRRSTVATNFNRDARQSISFSSSSATVPLMPGAQDRLSVLFQIGAMLLVNPELATVGGRIDIPVAGVRGELETWVFETQGIETIEVGIGPLTTAHLRRIPKTGSNDKTIDIWIAHLEGGYPARVLYTEPNGSTIEMTLEKIEAMS